MGYIFHIYQSKWNIIQKVEFYKSSYCIVLAKKIYRLVFVAGFINL